MRGEIKVELCEYFKTNISNVMLCYLVMLFADQFELVPSDFQKKGLFYRSKNAHKVEADQMLGSKGPLTNADSQCKSERIPSICFEIVFISLGA